MSASIGEFIQKHFGKLILVLFGLWLAYSFLGPRFASNGADEKAASLDELGLDATIAASSMWSAYKSCRTIGVPNLALCTQHTGPLPIDKGAPQLAKLALGFRESYLNKCLTRLSQEECETLLNRAFHVAQSQTE